LFPSIVRRGTGRILRAGPFLDFSILPQDLDAIANDNDARRSHFGERRSLV
jgi:hypothetical protein